MDFASYSRATMQGAHVSHTTMQRNTWTYSSDTEAAASHGWPTTSRDEQNLQARWRAWKSV